MRPNGAGWKRLHLRFCVRRRCRPCIFGPSDWPIVDTMQSREIHRIRNCAVLCSGPQPQNSNEHKQADKNEWLETEVGSDLLQAVLKDSAEEQRHLAAFKEEIKE